MRWSADSACFVSPGPRFIGILADLLGSRTGEVLNTASISEEGCVVKRVQCRSSKMLGL